MSCHALTRWQAHAPDLTHVGAFRFGSMFGLQNIWRSGWTGRTFQEIVSSGHFALQVMAHDTAYSLVFPPKTWGQTQIWLWSVDSEEPWGQLHPIAVSLSSRLLLQRPSRAHTFKLSRSYKAKWTMPMFPNALMFTNLWQLDTACLKGWGFGMQLKIALILAIRLAEVLEELTAMATAGYKSWSLQFLRPMGSHWLQWVHAQYALLHCFSFSIPLCIDPYLGWHLGWHLQ